MAAVTAQSILSTSHRSQPYSFDHQHYQYHPSTSSSTALMPSYHHPINAARGVFSSSSSAVHGSPSSYRNMTGAGYDSYTTAREGTAATSSTQTLDADSYSYASLSPRKRHTSKYVDEEARQAAKMVQKARRREQNRNAQRRLGDREEEHIFKLEGEVAALRRQSERDRSEKQDLEEMIRRLLDQREDMQRRLDTLAASGREDYNASTQARCAPSSSHGRAKALSQDNALGLVDDASYVSSSRSSSSSTSDADARESGLSQGQPFIQAELPAQSNAERSKHKLVAYTAPPPEDKTRPLAAAVCSANGPDAAAEYG
ncbi:hypothetical protein [Sporisorium scitamineum]|uniref:BZIP domain-containing protein n=1 Tax=Sporisorium scitamineum TaxID=49012 RepID=A0A0F7S5P1_9BASI|nr:hypothetical protein [Sporisorium scitamineum]